MTADALHPYQIAVCQTTGWASPVIKWATGGKETHTYIVLPETTWSMEPDGLVERPLGYWGESSFYSQYETTLMQQKRLEQFITASRDLKYDYAGDVIVGGADITPRWMAPFWHLVEHLEDVLTPRRAFCSSFADRAFTEIGITVISGRRLDRSVTPMDLYRSFVAKGWARG